MNGLERLTTIRNISLRKGKTWIHKDIFRILNKDDIWSTAYQNICNDAEIGYNKINTEILGEFKIPQLLEIKKSVINESYRPTSSKIKNNYKLHTDRNQFDFLIFVDLIILEVIQMILEAIFDPIFCESTFGYKNSENEHSALQYVEKEFSDCDLILQGDFENMENCINATIFCNFINNHVKDIKFVNLIRKLLNSELNNRKEINLNWLHIKQKKIKNLFLNIYLYQFDAWLKKFQSLNSGVQLENENEYEKNANCKPRITKLLIDDSCRLYNSKKWKPKISYVRYEENWIIGIKGDKSFAAKIKEKVTNFLETKLKMMQPNMKIVSLTAGNVSFLDYELYKIRIESTNTRLKKNRLKFDAPINKLLNRLEKCAIIKNTDKGYRPVSKRNYTTLDDRLIVEHFTSIWSCIYKYYSGISNLQKLQYIHYLVKMSCAMTLAHKHNSTCTQIFKKRGKSLIINSFTTKRKICFEEKAKLTIRNRKWHASGNIVNPFMKF